MQEKPEPQHIRGFFEIFRVFEAEPREQPARGHVNAQIPAVRPAVGAEPQRVALVNELPALSARLDQLNARFAISDHRSCRVLPGIARRLSLGRPMSVCSVESLWLPSDSAFSMADCSIPELETLRRGAPFQTRRDREKRHDRKNGPRLGTRRLKTMMNPPPPVNTGSGRDTVDLAIQGFVSWEWLEKGGDPEYE